MYLLQIAFNYSVLHFQIASKNEEEKTHPLVAKKKENHLCNILVLMRDMFISYHATRLIVLRCNKNHCEMRALSPFDYRERVVYHALQTPD